MKEEHPMRSRNYVWCAGLAALAACGPEEIGPDREQNGAARPSSFDEAVAQGGARLEADEVMGVLVVHSSAIHQQNQLAFQRAQDPILRILVDRALAQSSFDRQLLDLALQRLGVSPVESQISSALQQRAAQIQIELELMGEDFDRAFLEAQIAAQREVINVLDESNACAQVRIAGCSGFAGRLGVEETLPQEFDERALFTRLRSTLLSQLTEASVTQSMIAAAGSPIAPPP
jgi:predicted outer membrane protein